VPRFLGALYILEVFMAEVKKSKRQAQEKKSVGLKISDFKNSRDIPYHKITVTCACGGEFESGSIQEVIRVDICAKCHPFFTGENKILDAEGRVDKFRRRYNLTAK